MRPQQYARFSGREIILRDHLAIDRTILANQRIFLTHLSFALTTVIAGVTIPIFLKFRLLFFKYFITVNTNHITVYSKNQHGEI